MINDLLGDGHALSLTMSTLFRAKNWDKQAWPLIVFSMLLLENVEKQFHMKKDKYFDYFRLI